MEVFNHVCGFFHFSFEFSFASYNFQISCLVYMHLELAILYFSIDSIVYFIFLSLVISLVPKSTLSGIYIATSTFFICTIQWFLEYHIVAHYHHNLSLEGFYHPKWNTVPISTHFLSISPLPHH